MTIKAQTGPGAAGHLKLAEPPPPRVPPTYRELEDRCKRLEQDLRSEVLLRVAAENRLAAVRVALDK